MWLLLAASFIIAATAAANNKNEYDVDRLKRDDKQLAS